MQLFKYVSLSLWQQKPPDDVVLPHRGKQSHLSKGPIEKDEKKAKTMNLTQNFYMEKRKSVTLALSQSMSGDGIEWNLKPKPIIIPNINQIQNRMWMIWDHKTFDKNLNDNVQVRDLELYVTGMCDDCMK